MAKAVTKHEDLTPEDEALITAVQERDLAPPGPKLIALLQNNSTKMLEKIKGSKAGDYAVPREGEHILCKATVGVSHVPVGYERFFVKWAPNRGGYVDKHPRKPSDARWPDRKQGFWRDNGNKIEDTVFAICLSFSMGASRSARHFRFGQPRSTSDSITKTRPSGIKIENSKLGGAVVSKWRMTSRIERDGDFSWYVPVLDSRGRVRPTERSDVRAGASSRSTASGL